MGEMAPIDVDRLRRTFEDDTILAELYGMYLEDTARRLADLRGALDCGDAERCRRTGHTLKGSSANIGAGTMREIAAELESADTPEIGERSRDLVGALESEFARIEVFINNFIEAVAQAN